MLTNTQRPGEERGLEVEGGEGARAPTLRRVLVLLITGAVGAVLLDRFTPLDTCDYDACRYVREPELSIDTSDLGVIAAPPATVLMHSLYGNAQFAGHPFLTSFAKNVVILLALLPLVGAHPLLASPLAMSFVWLPGKEALLVFGIMLLSAVRRGGPRGAKRIVQILLAAAFIAVSRLPFLFVFGLAYALERTLARRKLVAFALITGAAVAATLLLSDVLELSELMTVGLEQESSIAAFAELRTLTFGFTITGILLRAAIYFAYLAVLPLVEVFRLVIELPTTGLMPYHLYLLGATAQFATLSGGSALRHRARTFLVTAVVIACAFSFVHTRYLLPVVLLLIALQPSADPSGGTEGAEDESRSLAAPAPDPHNVACGTHTT